MADPESDSEVHPVQPVKPPTKRRRILDPSAIIPVPVYSNKVSSSLQLKPMAQTFTEKETTDDCSWSEFSSRDVRPATVTFSDSEEENEEVQQEKKKPQLEGPCCPSPPPPESPLLQQSRKVQKKISEINRKLQAVNSLLSPEPVTRRSRRRRGSPSPSNRDDEDLIMITPNDDDDIIVVTPDSRVHDSLYSSSVREIPLKVRCRTDVHKLPVLSSTPLSEVVRQLSVILNVPPPRLLLMKQEAELPTDATVSEVGLGIADIIECVVMAAEDRGDDNAASSGFITIRLQGKDKDSGQGFSLQRDGSFGSIFSQYLSTMALSVPRRQVRFHFDGSSVSPSQTPAQLDMEDGDIIEVWT